MKSARTISRRVGAVAALALRFMLPAAGQGDWKNSYAGLSRSCYLVNEEVAPPHALAWEYESPELLRESAIIALGRSFITTRQFHVYCLDLEGGTPLWKFEEPTGAAEAVSLDALTGRLRWRRNVSGKVIHTPQGGSDAVYVATEAGMLHVLSQFDGKEYWQTRLAMPLTLPAVDRRLVAICSGSNLVLLGNNDGKEVGSVPLPAEPVFFPAMDNDGVYVALPRAVEAFRREGKRKWSSATRFPLSAPLALTKHGLLAATADGSVVMLSTSTGKEIWRVLLAGTPKVLSGTGDAVYAGTHRGTVVCMRLRDGAKMWSVDTGRQNVDGIALSDGHLLVTAGKWVGALIRAPSPPEMVSAVPADGHAAINWEAGVANGYPITGYCVWRSVDGRDWQRVGRNGPDERHMALPAAIASDFYAVSAMAANGAESGMSRPFRLDRREPLITRVRLAPMPYEPRRGLLRVNFVLREACKVAWSMYDAEGQPVTIEQRSFLARGGNTLTWDGRDGTGRMVYPGTYKADIRAVRDDETDGVVRPVALLWGLDARDAMTGRGGNAPRDGIATPPADDGSPGEGKTGKDHGNNGVRDHGKGEGRDGAGQGKGQGSDNGKKDNPR